MWDFPLLLKSRLGAGPVKPYLEAGASFRRFGDLAGVVTKLLEGASIVLLIRFLTQLRPNLRWASQSILSLFLFGVLLGVGVYGVSRAWEPLLPGLASPESHNLEEHSH